MAVSRASTSSKSSPSVHTLAAPGQGNSASLLPVDEEDFNAKAAAGFAGPRFNQPAIRRVSFTSTGDGEGLYNGQSLAEQNNNLQEILY